MLHMNKNLRYKQLYQDINTVYVMRGSNFSHYIAGLAVGAEIQRGLSDTELSNLKKIFDAARNAK